jgi:hypothetical protein
MCPVVTLLCKDMPVAVRSSRCTSVLSLQMVKKGDLLFTVDPRPYQAELDSAVATVDLTDLKIGAALMTYIGEGGGALSYLAIGGTAFVIAFSAPGLRTDMVGSIRTIWGISLGMIIRAVVSVVWREHMNRTLAEEFERPLAALVRLTRSASLEEHEIVAAEMAIITGVQAMLTVATDAQLRMISLR